nr:acyl-CoA synthetase family member 2, mitochondrial-like [Leptinotarsa decemlineata]
MFRLTSIRKIVKIEKETIWCRKYSKISYLNKVGNEPLRPLTIGKLLEEICVEHGKKTAIISCHQEEKMEFDEVLYQADRLAAGMLKMGFRQGDMVGLWAPNMIEWYISFMACARAGFVMAGLNPQYQQKEMEYVINKVGIRGIICGSIFRKQNFYEILESVCPKLFEGKPGKLENERLPSLKSVIMISKDKMRGTDRYTDVLNMTDDEGMQMVRENQKNIKIDDPANIQFTSGTTGFSKAAVLSHFSAVNNGFYIGKRNGFHRKHHKICVQNPLFHAYGTIIGIAAATNFANTLVLPSDGHDPKKTLAVLQKEKCTILYGTPTMYVDLIDLQKNRKENLHIEMALTGGASCSPQLFKDILNVLQVKKVRSIYGLSESTASAFQSLEDDDELRSTSTVGPLQEHLEAKIIDEKGQIVPIGVPGELCIRGYSTLLEYYGDEEKTKEVKGYDGWLRTGDQFIFTEDGYGVVVGRFKEMIIRGGENIYPKEIEDYLNTHPDILESHVIGLPHARLGEEVCVCLRTKNGQEFTVKEIQDFCRGKLAKFKIPSIVKMVDSFPTTTSGKVQKYKLVQLLLDNKK